MHKQRARCSFGGIDRNKIWTIELAGVSGEGNPSTSNSSAKDETAAAASGGLVQAQRTREPRPQAGRDHEAREVAQRTQVHTQSGLLLR